MRARRRTVAGLCEPAAAAQTAHGRRTRCQGYHARVLACAPQLRELDGMAVAAAERSAAEASAAGAEPVALPAARPAPVAWPFGAAPGALRQLAIPAPHAELRALRMIGALLDPARKAWHNEYACMFDAPQTAPWCGKAGRACRMSASGWPAQ